MKNQQILYLIEYLDEHKSASGQECADRLGISLSTFKRELKKTEDLFEEHGFTVTGRTGHGNGYRFEIHNQAKLDRFIAGLREECASDAVGDLNSSENRIRYIVREFLSLDGEYIRMDEMAEEMMLSRTQLAKDIQSVRSFFRLWHLDIVSKPHYGSMLAFQESDLRNIQAELMLNEIHMDEEGVLYLHPHEDPDETEDLDRIQNVIIDNCDRKTYDLNDITVRDLSAHFLAGCRRMADGHFTRFKEEMKKELLAEKEKPLAEQIIQKLADLYGITFNEDELCYVIIHMCARQMAHRSMISEDIRETVDDMLEEVLNKHRLDLRDDENLKTFLSLHTAALLKRQRYNINLTNPFLRDIRSNYIASYDIALSAGRVIEQKYQCRLSEDETAYYALHFKIAAKRHHRKHKSNVLIVCSSGRGTAKMLEYNMHYWFDSRLNRVDTCNKFELARTDIAQYDCIFTTVPLKEKYDIPVYMIDAFFDSANMRMIENVLSRKNTREDGTRYFLEELFFTDVEAASPEDAILAICKKIRAVRTLPEGFEKSITEREQIQNTQLGLIALPRTYGIVTETPVIAFAVLKQPVRWHRESVQVVILTSCPEGFYKENRMFYTFVRQLATSRHYVRSLIQSRSYETLLDIYEEIIRKGN